MLELKKKEEFWRWSAQGKQQSLPEYLAVGEMYPVAAALGEWVRKGFTEQSMKETSRRTPCSWRFWVKGSSRDEIICGLLSDSRDSVGRPYPLLIMGNGTLEGWERHWEELPAACESTWSRMEQLVSAYYRNLDSLARGVASLPPPTSLWSVGGSLPEVKADGGEHLTGDEMDVFNENIRALSGKKCGYIIVDQFNDCDRVAKTEFVGKTLNRYLAGSPTAVFIGVMAENSCFAFYNRALTGADFSTLWTQLPQRFFTDIS